MKIATDLDDVLTDTMGGVIANYNEKHGTLLTEKDFISSDFWKIWGGTKAEAVKEILDFHDSVYGTEMQPTAEAAAGIAELKKDGDELYLVTGRYDEVMEETHRWLGVHFPDTFLGIYNTNHFSLTTTPKTKAEICKSVGATLLIDDNLDHALGCAKEGIDVILLDKPWNQDVELPSNITRVYTWSEILEKIAAIKKL